MQYRRTRLNGGKFFFTTNLANRSSAMLIEHIDQLRLSVAHVKKKYPFGIIAWVVMPEHIHAIWQMPDGDSDYSLRWALIKSHFSRHIAKLETIKPSRQSKRERGIWQRRFWEHLIRDNDDLDNHIRYIHNNPVKHGYVQNAADWPYSSIHRGLD